MIWLIDFSDTLVTGSKTWAFEHVFPELIRENNLPFDAWSFREATLKAQQRANETRDEAAVLDEMFARLCWPDHLKKELVRRVFELYEPKLFDDTIPFLDKLSQSNQKLVIVSNTSQAPELAKHFKIDKYFEYILTPNNCGGVAGKPDVALWKCLANKLRPHETLPPESAIVVGDDPWSDGTFAARCDLSCWIIDRKRRMASLRQKISVNWAQSLLELPV